MICFIGDIFANIYNFLFPLRYLSYICKIVITDQVKDMTEKEKMLAGQVYSAVDRELLEDLNAVKEIIHDYNSLRPSETRKRLEILKESRSA